MTAKKPDKIIFISLILAAAVFVIGAYARGFPLMEIRGQGNSGQGQAADINTEKENSPVIGSAASFFDREAFFSSIELAGRTKENPDVRAIIVPHHLVASEYIAKMIKGASGRMIKTVVIIGPNHENLGANPLAAAKSDWETPFGVIQHDRGLAEKFLADLNLSSCAEIFENEHSVGAIMPFIKYYLKEARVMPVIISSYARQNDMKELNDWLAGNIGEDSLIIYSLDFSHYLAKDEADENDDITRELILSRDIGKILTLNNDFVDSPPILALSLLYAEEKGLKTDIAFHGNSYDFALVKPSETTSYYAVNFSIPNR